VAGQVAIAGYACHFPKYPEFNKAQRLEGDQQTNNQAEFSALLLAEEQWRILCSSLEHVNPEIKNEPVTIYTDSMLLVNTVTKWMTGWKSKGWRKAGGHEVANLDLVKRIDEMKMIYTIKHVRAHTGNSDYWSVNNAIVDDMATTVAR
jgi:ribonuclease HI